MTYQSDSLARLRAQEILAKEFQSQARLFWKASEKAIQILHSAMKESVRLAAAAKNKGGSK